MDFLKYLAVFAIPLMATVYLSPLPQQASPVAHFSQCIDAPDRTKCVNERFEAMDKITSASMSQLGMNAIAAFDLDYAHRR